MNYAVNNCFQTEDAIDMQKQVQKIAEEILIEQVKERIHHDTGSNLLSSLRRGPKQKESN